jgi:hypothetical protein
MGTPQTHRGPVCRQPRAHREHADVPGGQRNRRRQLLGDAAVRAVGLVRGRAHTGRGGRRRRRVTTHHAHMGRRQSTRTRAARAASAARVHWVRVRPRAWGPVRQDSLAVRRQESMEHLCACVCVCVCVRVCARALY